MTLKQTKYERVTGRYAVVNLRPDRILRPDSIEMDFTISCNPKTILTPCDDENLLYRKMGYYTHNQDTNILFMPLYAVTDERYTVYYPMKSSK